MNYLIPSLSFCCMATAYCACARAAAQGRLKECDADREYRAVRSARFQITRRIRTVKTETQQISKLRQAIKFGVAFGHEGADLLEWVLLSEHVFLNSSEAILEVCRWSLRGGRLPHRQEIEDDVLLLHMK